MANTIPIHSYFSEDFLSVNLPEFQTEFRSWLDQIFPVFFNYFAFLCFRFGASILPEAPPTDVFTPSLVRRPPPSQTRNQKVKYNFCVFCKNNGEDESYYLSHTLKVRKSQKKNVDSSISQKKLFFSWLMSRVKIFLEPVMFCHLAVLI